MENLTIDDKDLITEEIELIIANDERLLGYKDMILRGAERNECKGSFDLDKMVQAYDKNCVMPAIKFHNSHSDYKILLKKPDRVTISKSIIVSEYNKYKENLNA